MSKLDPAQTIITLTDDIPWCVPDLAPPNSVAEAVMAGSEDGEGAYLVLMKWYPGWMSAPHTYVTDRLCVVISGRGGATAGRTSTRDRRCLSTPGASCTGSQEPRITTVLASAQRSPPSLLSAASVLFASSGWTLHNRCFANGEESRIGLSECLINDLMSPWSRGGGR